MGRCAHPADQCTLQAFGALKFALPPQLAKRCGSAMSTGECMARDRDCARLRRPQVLRMPSGREVDVEELDDPPPRITSRRLVIARRGEPRDRLHPER